MITSLSVRIMLMSLSYNSVCHHGNPMLRHDQRRLLELHQSYVYVCPKLLKDAKDRIRDYLFHLKKKGREKSRECHNHKPHPFPDPKRKRKPTNPNKHKPNKRTKSTKISSLSSPAILKGLKNTRTKWHTEIHATNRLVE